MKKIIFFASVLLIVGFVRADEKTTMDHSTPSILLGVDSAIPYALRVDGNKVNKRGNINMGVDGRYFTTENMNMGLRFAYDVEKQTGSTRQLSIAPGAQYRWFQGETWTPYVRADLPVVLHGAASSTASTSQKDVGLSGGAGLAWNVGNAIGATNLLVRYDFNVSYLFGFGNALSTLGIEFARLGIDYKF